MSTQKSRRNSDNFIMLPTVDFCFKELMQNPKVRKGFIAAILGKSPGTIRRTTFFESASMSVFLILFIFLRMRNAVERLYSVTQSQANSIRISWNCIFWSLRSCRLKIRVRMGSSDGCDSSEGRTGRSSRIWQRKMNISKRLIMN